MTTAAIILAGSQAWAAGSLESICPRPLLPIANTRLISYTLDWLKGAGVRTMIVCANDVAGLFRDYLRDGSQQELDICHYQDRTPRGSAGCCRDAAAMACAEQYLIVDGSIIPRVDLPALLEAHARSEADLTVAVNQTPEGDDWLAPHLSPVGMYVFGRAAIEMISPTGYEDIKEMLIPRLRREGGSVMAYLAEGPCPRIEGLESYLAVQGWVLGKMCAGGAAPWGYEHRDGVCVHESASVAEDARLLGPALIGPRSTIEGESVIVGPTIIGSDCRVGRRSVVGRSVMWDRCSVSSQARVDQCLLTEGAFIQEGESQLGAIN